MLLTDQFCTSALHWPLSGQKSVLALYDSLSDAEYLYLDEFLSNAAITVLVCWQSVTLSVAALKKRFENQIWCNDTSNTLARLIILNELTSLDLLTFRPMLHN